MTAEERAKRKKAREHAAAWRVANPDRPHMRQIDKLLVEAFLRSCPKENWPTVIGEVRITLEDAGFDDAKSKEMIRARLKALRNGRVSYAVTRRQVVISQTPPLLPHTQNEKRDAA